VTFRRWVYVVLIINMWYPKSDKTEISLFCWICRKFYFTLKMQWRKNRGSGCSAPIRAATSKIRGKKIMNGMIQLQSTHTIFHSGRGHLRTQKASELLAAGGSPQTPLGKLTAIPRPSRKSLLPFQTLFLLSDLLASLLKLLLNRGLAEPGWNRYATAYHIAGSDRGNSNSKRMLVYRALAQLKNG